MLHTPLQQNKNLSESNKCKTLTNGFIMKVPLKVSVKPLFISTYIHIVTFLPFKNAYICVRLLQTK